MKEIENEISDRKIFLDYLLKNDLRSNKVIADLFKRFYQDKNEILDKI